MKRRCENCGYCIRVNQGWSSWTVTGTDLYCWLNLNPAMPYDDWYGEDSRGEFAAKCPAYDVMEADGFDLEVDGENWDELTPEQQAWCLENGYDRRTYVARG